MLTSLNESKYSLQYTKRATEEGSEWSGSIKADSSSGAILGGSRGGEARVTTGLTGAADTQVTLFIRSGLALEDMMVSETFVNVAGSVFSEFFKVMETLKSSRGIFQIVILGASLVLAEADLAP